LVSNQTTSPQASARSAPYAGLRELVILGGTVRSSALSSAIGRSLLDLPLNETETLLDRWVAEVDTLVGLRGLSPLNIRVMLDAASAAPRLPETAAGYASVHQRRITIEQDPFEFRGTGGVLHDTSKSLADDDYLLVVGGAQLPTEPLTDLVDALADHEGDAVLLAHRDGTPSGLMLLRCGVLRGISELGFVDLKEQALPSIARQFHVAVEYRPRAGLSFRGAQDYLGALRFDHRRRRGEAVSPDAYTEDWHSEFTVAEPGAAIAPTARLFDSVVLTGGTVGENALLVRTIVCPGGVVKPGERLIDQLVTAVDTIPHTSRGDA